MTCAECRHYNRKFKECDLTLEDASPSGGCEEGARDEVSEMQGKDTGS